MDNHDNTKPGRRKRPKGAYPLPTGGFVRESRHHLGKRRITIQVVRREHVDTKELARIFLMVAEEEIRRERRLNSDDATVHRQ